MTRDPWNVAAVRAAVEDLIARGQLADPRTTRTAGDAPIVLEIDDHLSDEAMGAGRLRLVLRSPRELRALARALEEQARAPRRRRR
jgi:hypothetical protein